MIVLLKSTIEDAIKQPTTKNLIRNNQKLDLNRKKGTHGQLNLEKIQIEEWEFKQFKVSNK